jgi:hypothetical protein
MAKLKLDPPVVIAVPENPPSSLADRVAVRVDGLTYLLPPGQAEGFKARAARVAVPSLPDPRREDRPRRSGSQSEGEATAPPA